MRYWRHRRWPYNRRSELAAATAGIDRCGYTYDTAGRRTSLSTTRDGTTWDTTTWTHNPYTGNCLSKTYADGTTVTYSYTPDNLPLRTTYASGRWIENVYDSQRRLVGTLSSDGQNNATYAFDEFGRTTSAANSVASIAYSLSDIGKATNEFWTVGTNTLAISRSFDSQDRLSCLALPSVGYALNYTYATDGRLAAVSNDVAVVTYDYTPDRLDVGYTIAFANGATFTRTMTRDPFRRELITSITNSIGGASIGFIYDYDALSRPVTRNADTFGYNARSEVTSATIAGGLPSSATAHYGYDDIGNLLNSSCNASTNFYTANNLNQYASIQVTSATFALSEGELVTSYDLDGNMTQCGDWTYTYDAANHLTTVSSNGVLLVTNFYDAKSRRVKKVTQNATTTFFYDDWNLIEERVAYTNGTIATIHYYWGKDLSGALQGAGGVGGLLYLTIDDVPYIPCYDNIGNITRYLDVNGNVVAQYAYDVFGGTLSQSGSLASFFRHRFSTKCYDIETGLYYYGYRFYSPVLMRWLNRDPIEEEGGLNLYAGCKNNFMSSIDPLGESWFDCFVSCVEEWRLDWGKAFSALNAMGTANTPVPKTLTERRWIGQGVSEDTTYLSRAISQGERLARKLPLGSVARSNLVRGLGNVRRFMRNPVLIRAGVAGAALTVFEGFYDIGTMLYCSVHCCGE